MRARQHFLIALGAMTLCSGAAIAAAQDEGQQPSPETTTQPTLPQSMPPEQANMEDQMLTRGEAGRGSTGSDSAQRQADTRDDENVAHLVQGGQVAGLQTPQPASQPRPSYPQKTEDELSASATSSTSAAGDSRAPQMDAQSERMTASQNSGQSGQQSSDATRSDATAEPAAELSQTGEAPSSAEMKPSSEAQSAHAIPAQAASAPAPTMPGAAIPPARTSTHDETSQSHSSLTTTASEQPVQSESPMDQGNTQLTDAAATLQAKFDALDTDHDGTIDRDEAAASDVLSAQFNTLDTRGDGKLTLDEFTTATNLSSVRVDRKVHQE